MIFYNTYLVYSLINMGNTQSQRKVSFEDIQFVVTTTEIFILINTLPLDEQFCLIYNTSDSKKEEELINHFMQQGKYDIKIIIYGRNCNDETIYTKEQQLRKIGFTNTYIYPGGLFEWLMLQDIYGENEFPTTSKQLDILKYKPNKIIDVKLIGL